jgi:hypothetical protein
MRILSKKEQDSTILKRLWNRNKKWWLILWRLIWKFINWMSLMLIIRCIPVLRIIDFGYRKRKRICFIRQIMIPLLIILPVDLENFLLIFSCFIIMLFIVLKGWNINRLLNFLIFVCRLSLDGLMLCLDRLLAIFYKNNIPKVKDALR